MTELQVQPLPLDAAGLSASLIETLSNFYECIWCGARWHKDGKVLREVAHETTSQF